MIGNVRQGRVTEFGIVDVPSRTFYYVDKNGITHNFKAIRPRQNAPKIKPEALNLKTGTFSYVFVAFINIQDAEAVLSVFGGNQEIQSDQSQSF